MRLKAAVIVYHKNIKSIYPKDWVDKFKLSILNQTDKDFVIVELNYGGDGFQIFDKALFINEVKPTFVHSMNYLLDLCFYDLKMDCVFNTNCDDYYDLKRIELQKKYIKDGYDIISSNFNLIQNETEVHQHYFDALNIEHELNKSHNIIAHPAVCYSKNFWNTNRYLPEEVPYEDMRLWQRAIKRNKFIILKENLLFHRLHNNSVCQSSNR